MPQATSPIDENVLKRARDGDRQAHAELYRAYAAMVYTVAYRMLGSKSSAEDVVQDSFVDVIRKAGDFRGDGDIRGWIKRIAINKSLSHLRSPWVSRRSKHQDVEQEPSTGKPDGGSTTLNHQQDLEQALAALPPTSRAVVWLHDVEGYTHEEIGRLMSRSTSFSKSQLARAYRQLRDLLQPEDQPADSERGTEPCLGVLKTV